MTVWMRKVPTAEGAVETIEIMGAQKGDSDEVTQWCADNLPASEWATERITPTTLNIMFFEDRYAVEFRLRWAEEFSNHPLDFRIESVVVNAPSRKLNATWTLLK